MIQILLIGLICLPTPVFAGLKYHSENLTLMDIESIERIVDRNLAAAERAGGGVAPEDENSEFADGGGSSNGSDPLQLFKESTELVLARPEQNASTSLVYSKIDSASDIVGGMEKILVLITDQAIDLLGQDGTDKELLRAQNTYVHILNNLMTEIKPQVVSGEKPYRQIVERIRDADIEFSDEFKSHRILNSMKNITNPSKLAATLVGKKKCAWWEFLWC